MILGSGPAGAAAAMYLLRQGITPVIYRDRPFRRSNGWISRTSRGQNESGPKELPAFWRLALSCKESGTAIADS
jgi:thioredoxin reductase